MQPSVFTMIGNVNNEKEMLRKQEEVEDEYDEEEEGA